jgi:hypothetical protein
MDIKIMLCLLFTDKPSSPQGPLVAEEVRANHVKVKWNKPEDSGGTDVTGYVLEKMDLDTGRWVPAGEVNFFLMYNLL